MSRSSSRIDLLVAAQLELGLNLLFEHHEAKLVEPGRLLPCEPLAAEVGERLATEEESASLSCSARATRPFAGGSAVRRSNRRMSTESCVREAQPIARVLRFDPLGTEPLPQCGDMAMKRSQRRFGRAFPPERLDAVFSRDDLVSVQQQQSEQGAALPPRAVRSTPSASTSDLPSSRNSTSCQLSHVGDRSPRKPRVSGPETHSPGSRQKGRVVPVPELSLTEERIVLLLADGRSKAEIAEAVGLDVRTVGWHLERAGRKLEQASALHKRVRETKQ